MILSRISPTVSMSALILRMLHIVSTNNIQAEQQGSQQGEGEDQTGDVTKGDEEGTLDQGIHNSLQQSASHRTDQNIYIALLPQLITDTNVSENILLTYKSLTPHTNNNPTKKKL